jgi:hypothetical protein
MVRLGAGRCVLVTNRAIAAGEELTWSYHTRYEGSSKEGSKEGSKGGSKGGATGNAKGAGRASEEGNAVAGAPGARGSGDDGGEQVSVVLCLCGCSPRRLLWA